MILGVQIREFVPVKMASRILKLGVLTVCTYADQRTTLRALRAPQASRGGVVQRNLGGLRPPVHVLSI